MTTTFGRCAFFSSSNSEDEDDQVFENQSQGPVRCHRSPTKSPRHTTNLRPRLIGAAKSVHLALTCSSTSSLSPVPKRLLCQKTKSESSLMDWVFRPKCCRSAACASESDFKNPYIIDCLTLTPLSFDSKTESLEICRSVLPAVSPLPWDTLLQADYPQWLYKEFQRVHLSSQRSLNDPFRLAKAKSEDRSRSYTIPNLPSKQIPSNPSLAEEVVLKSSSSHPADLDAPEYRTAVGLPGKTERHNSTRRLGRHNTADITFPEFLLENVPDTTDATEENPPCSTVLQSRRAALTPCQTFADSRTSSLGQGGGSNDHLAPVSLSSQRRRSSVVVIPPMQICPGDLLIYSQSPVGSSKPPRSPSTFDRYGPSADLTGSTASLSSSEVSATETRKKPWSLLKLFDRSSRLKSDPGNLEDQLLTLKLSDYNDESLMRYKILHWSDLTPMTPELSEAEIKRREAIWEMFQSELVLLFDHLLVLKHVFLEPLKQLQVENFLMNIAPEKLFGNLDELIATNYELCVDFAQMMEKAAKDNDSFSLDIPGLLHQQETTSEFEIDQHSTALAFQRYCLNYIKSLDYLETCRKSEDFNEYEKFCSQDRRCHRLQLTDLLVTPVQHTMKRPLLLREICKHSEKCGLDCTQLKIVLEETEASLRGLDEKISWLRNFEKLQVIQRQLIWPSVIDLQDPKIFVPEVLKAHLAKQPCESLILSPRRIIVQEGTLYMIENGKPVEMQVFLFDDMLLLTKKRKGLTKKKSSVSEQFSQTSSSENATRYVVYKQPMPLDRIMVHDVSSTDQANPLLKNSLVILHVSRYQQIIGAITLQAVSEPAKILWLTKIRLAMDRWRAAHLEHGHSFTDQTFTQFSTVSEF